MRVNASIVTYEVEPPYVMLTLHYVADASLTMQKGDTLNLRVKMDKEMFYQHLQEQLAMVGEVATGT